ncbi:death-associated inhibitor of apoptosis 1-like isoform X1 [Dreissena polymorpha]|uniref:Uncharacterized protein n=1 Tax=Dreissena polymorpha TaxID=45954 RepID=A0A9D4HY19_DREPO|nr:death-associated inhibitor of apoptosis 1-like isoform X1 [Dreissena polymorpha]XP_052238245.1 death-associated inhibitor of apoptosis 1-like isoform X1 [Dreissena polymorpha]XP_052238246.1 death-associated inhibitor of apoptosis 1-like isoform X1 [Dreissena polymorpha]KAH3739600.1 hypothetical protein DPMN_046254 [Dreissena polymorpha]
MMGDDSSEDEEPEDYAPDPREYYSHFYRESERLTTFHDWPQWANVTKEDLAKNGFMYLHVSDRVQCVFCRASLGSFGPGDIVADEHRKYCPECPFAFGYECGNIPIPSANRVQQPTQTVQSLNARNRARPVASGNFAHFSNRAGLVQPILTPSRSANATAVQQSHSVISLSTADSNQGAAAVITEPKYRDWADEHTRLRSYRGWPAQMRQTPRDLAAAGLLYMGQGDRCKCYWCGGELHGWEPDDDPWVEHAKWFPQCGFVRQQKGVEYVNHIKYGERTNIESTSNQEFLRRPYVLAAMNDYGYTQEQVLEALHTYGVLILVTVQDIRKYVEELNSERQAAQTLARISERFVSSNRSDSSVAMTDRGQQVAQPSDDMEVSSGQLCSEDVRIEGMEESQYPDSLTQQQMQNLSLNSHSSSSISL